TAHQIDVAVDGQDAPWITYGRLDQENKAVVARWNGSAWEDRGIARHDPTKASQPDSLALDASGHPYVAFTELLVTNNLGTIRPWVQRTDPPPVLSIGDTPSTGMPNYPPLSTLAFDGQDQPVIAWQPSNPFSGIRVSRFASGSWQQ